MKNPRIKIDGVCAKPSEWQADTKVSIRLKRTSRASKLWKMSLLGFYLQTKKTWL
jgi:hypothetical protein